MRAQQRPRFLLHAARELAGRPIGEGREPGALQKLRDATPSLVRGETEQPSEEVDVLEHGKRRIEVLAEALRGM